MLRNELKPQLSLGLICCFAQSTDFSMPNNANKTLICLSYILFLVVCRDEDGQVLVLKDIWQVIVTYELHFETCVLHVVKRWCQPRLFFNKIEYKW